MSLFARNKLIDQQNEEFFFGIVAQEVSSGIISQGLYAKALSEVEGDEVRAKALYIKLRSNTLKTEWTVRNDEEKAKLVADKMRREKLIIEENKKAHANENVELFKDMIRSLPLLLMVWIVGGVVVAVILSLLRKLL